MRLLASVLPRGFRTLPPGTGFTLALCGCLVGLEVVGRVAASDVHDGLAGFALLAIAATVAIRHRRAPLPWVTRLAGWIRRALASAAWLRFDHGYDLRGTPPIPRKTPRVVWAFVLLLVVWAGLAAAAWAAYPTGWRELGVHTLYTLYLAGLLALWAGLMACIFVGVYVPVEAIGRGLRQWLGETDRRGAELAVVVGYAVIVSMIASAVTPIWMLALCATVAVGAWLAYLPHGSDGAAVLWRAGPDRPVYSVPLHRLLAATAGLLALLLLAVLMTACGNRLFVASPAADAMPVTAVLGAVAAWTLPGLLAVAGLRLFGAWRNDPARRTPPTAHLSGIDPAALRRAAALVARWGWRVRTGVSAREPGSVGVEVVESERSEATEFDPRWPLRLSVADLEAGEVRQRLDRRDEIQVRRQLFRGLAKLFKRAAMFKGPGGGGFLLAPHWWFIEGMGREDAEGADETAVPPLVGPPYHRVLPPRARQHAHRVLRATQVDMIFVEDGVSYRKVEKVLRVLTELYDVHGGRRRAEELHFRGLPKVRVMIHEYEPGNPFQSELYPEPKFDDLSRVRVLHVFRDRGGHEERVEPPADFSWTPAPAGALG
jgi:hypothetical protein